MKVLNMTGQEYPVKVERVDERIFNLHQSLARQAMPQTVKIDFGVTDPSLTDERTGIPIID